MEMRLSLGFTEGTWQMHGAVPMMKRGLGSGSKMLRARLTCSIWWIHIKTQISSPWGRHEVLSAVTKICSCESPWEGVSCGNGRFVIALACGEYMLFVQRDKLPVSKCKWTVDILHFPESHAHILGKRFSEYRSIFVLGTIELISVSPKSGYMLESSGEF